MNENNEKKSEKTNNSCLFVNWTIANFTLRSFVDNKLSEKCSEIGSNFLPQLVVFIPRMGVMLSFSFTNLPDLDARSKPFF